MTAIRLLVIGTLLIVLAGFLPGLVAAAEATPSAYEMVVAIDGAYGDEVARGRYEVAIRRLSRQVTRFPNRDPFDTATNLCVAHTMIGQFKQAERYCDKALTVAEGTAAGGKGVEDRYSLRTVNDDWAQAYSNRGVLRALTGNMEGAEEDFRQATALEADSETAAGNLAWLHQATDAVMAGNPN